MKKYNDSMELQIKELQQNNNELTQQYFLIFYSNQISKLIEIKLQEDLCRI